MTVDRDTLEYEVRDRIATITFSRPEKRNSFTTAGCLELLATLDEADADDDVRVVVVTGSGRSFCAGADLDEGFVAEGATTTEAQDELLQTYGCIAGVPRDAGGIVSLRIARMDKPVIAAVNGSAVGVGATMTLPMDIRVVGTSTRVGFVFARRGLVPEAASSWFLPRVVGITRAMEWVATGRLVDAGELETAGYASRVVADDRVVETAREIAAEIVAHTSPVAVAASRHLLWGMLTASSPWDAHALDSQAIHSLAAGADVAEGVASFLDKRPPVFPLSVTEDFPAVVPRWPHEPDRLIYNQA
ncbi:MAG: enoyl-CoA hydratase-related protein [Aeromicrobium sp.]